MRRKLAGFAVGVISLFGLAGALPAAASTDDLPPPGCDAYRYGVLGGEGVAVNCDYAEFAPYLYRVVAHCVSNTNFWYQPGFWVETGFGPAVSECRGGLLSVARVVGYHVDER
jgi:hypothetical protein